MFNELSKLLDPNYCAIWLGIIWVLAFFYQLLLTCLEVKVRTYKFLGRAAGCLTLFLLFKPYIDGLAYFGREMGLLGEYLLLAGTVFSLAPALEVLTTKAKKSGFEFGFVALVFLLVWVARWPSGWQAVIAILASIAFAALLAIIISGAVGEKDFRDEMFSDIKSWYGDEPGEESKKFSAEDIPVGQLTSEELEEMGAYLYQEAGLKSLDSVSVKD